MAYSVERYAEFRDYNGSDWLINILKKDYSGSSTIFKCGGDGFTLKYQGEGDDIDNAIKGSDVTFEFYSESSTDDAFVQSLVDGDEGDYLLTIQFDADANGSYTNYWKGVLIVDNAKLSNLYYPQPFKLRAIDGISLLKGKKITELENLWDVDANGATGGAIEDFQTLTEDGVSYVGSVYQHRSLVLACLRLIPTNDIFVTGSTFVFNLSCWQNSKMTNQATVRRDPLWGVASRADSFYQSSTNGNFKYISCYDVLKNILEFYNMRIFMLAPGGYWQTIQVGCYEQMKTGYEFYVRYDNTDYGKTYDGSGSVSYNIGDLSNSSDVMGTNYQIADASFDYGKQIKEIEINVQTNTENVIDIGNTWQTNEDYTITSDPNPTSNDYIQTYSGVTAGQNMTFTLKIRGKITRDSAGSPTAGVLYFQKNYYYVKVENYYLYYDGTKYKWSTTEQPVFLANSSSILLIPNDVGGVYPFNVTIGAVSTDDMEPVPVTGQVEFYAYQVQYTYNDGVIAIDTNLQAHTTTITAPNYALYGYQSKAIEFNIYRAGGSYYNSIYNIQNKPSGTLVNGGLELKRDVLFFNGTGYMNSSIFTWDGSNGVIMTNWNLDFEPRWNNRNEGNDELILPVLKGVEMIGLQPDNAQMMQATFFHKQTSGNPRPLQFNDLFEYNSRYYIANGWSFNANESRWSGEWVSIDYDIGNATSATPFNNGNIATDTAADGELGFELF